MSSGQIPGDTNSDFVMRVLDDKPPKRATAVERTKADMKAGVFSNRNRINQAKSFINRAAKSDRRRKAEKQARKRNRGR